MLRGLEVVSKLRDKLVKIEKHGVTFRILLSGQERVSEHTFSSYRYRSTLIFC